MEASGATPAGAVHGPDLNHLFEQSGPFLSLYLATEAEIENAAQRSQTRWKSVREQLANDGTDEAVLAAIDPLVPEAHLEGQTLAVIAYRGGAVRISHPPEPPAGAAGNRRTRRARPPPHRPPRPRGASRRPPPRRHRLPRRGGAHQPPSRTAGARRGPVGAAAVHRTVARVAAARSAPRHGAHRP